MGPTTGRTVMETAVVFPSPEIRTCEDPGESAVTTPSAETLATAGFRLVPDKAWPARTRPRSSRRSAKSCRVSPTRNVPDAGTTVMVATGTVEEMDDSAAPQPAAAISQTPMLQERSDLRLLSGLSTG